MTAISRFNADVFSEEAEAIREEIDDLAMGNAISNCSDWLNEG